MVIYYSPQKSLNNKNKYKLAMAFVMLIWPDEDLCQNAALLNYICWELSAQCADLLSDIHMCLHVYVPYVISCCPAELGLCNSGYKCQLNA